METRVKDSVQDLKMYSVNSNNLEFAWSPAKRNYTTAISCVKDMIEKSHLDEIQSKVMDEWQIRGFNNNDADASDISIDIELNKILIVDDQFFNHQALEI